MNNTEQYFENFNKIDKKLLSYPTSLVYMNIRSLRLNFSTFLASINKLINQINIIVLVETNITDQENRFYNIKGFYSIFLNRENRGGGVVVYIAENLNFNQISLNINSFEAILIDININNNITSLLSIYRPPSANIPQFIKELETVIKTIKRKQNIILVGDINIDILRENLTTKTYLNMIMSYGLQCMVNQCTRVDITKKTKTCIDHMFLRNNKQTNATAAIITTSISDHFSLFCCIKEDINKQSKETLNFQGPHLNNSKINQMINNENWNTLMEQEQNPNNIFNKFHKKICQIYAKSEIKNKKISKKRSNNPWINEEVIKLCDFRDKLYKRWYDNQNNKRYEQEYKTFRNLVNKKIIYEKNNYYKNKFNEYKNDIKATWKLINEIIGKKTANLDDFIIKSFKNQNITDIINKFAVNLNENVRNIIHDCNIKTITNTDTTVTNTMYVESASEEEIYNILKNLNIRKGAGSDGIRAKDLKNNARCLTPIVTKLINTSLDQAIIPTLLKTSIIRPVYKSGEKADVSNYRPIAILSVIDKILEEVVATRLRSFLEKYRIINENQYGFQRGKNINQLLGNFSNLINEYISKNMHVLVIFIDFSKAFDTLSHKRLIEMLERNGIRGNMAKWFKNYLEYRNYYVKVNNIKSNQISNNWGVPQGSKIGPILYIIYTNDMLRCLKESTTYAYADDTAIVVADNNITNAAKRIQKQLNIATKWCHDNGLVINATKTKVMHIKAPHLSTSNIDLKFHNTQCLHYNKNRDPNNNDSCSTTIEMVENYKYLGIYIDRHFKWKTHIEYLQKKLRTASYMLYHLSNCTSYSVLRQAYFSLAESYIRHGITAWGNVKYKSTLQKTQNSLLKILWNKYSSSTNRLENTSNLAKNLNILNVKNIYHTTIIKEFENSNRFLQPLNHQHNTRKKAQGRYKVGRFTNEYSRCTLSVALPSILNSIPINIIKTNPKYKRYKLIKEYLINLQ